MVEGGGYSLQFTGVTALSKQEISFLRRYSLKKAVPTQKRDSCESEVILAVTSSADLEYASLFLTNVTLVRRTVRFSLGNSHSLIFCMSVLVIWLGDEWVIGPRAAIHQV